MILRGIDFGCVLNSSGARGFFGEGYRFHKLLKPFGLRYSGVTFVAKTTTLEPRPGNMPLAGDGITPTELFPRSVIVKPIGGYALNAVGLSGPGARFLFQQRRWQERTDPFFISFMSVAETAANRLVELRAFIDLFSSFLSGFKARVGLKINFSCPNVGIAPTDLLDEIDEALTIASALGVPLVPKFNATVPVDAALQISQHPACDAICLSNTIPWGQLPERIDWLRLFGTPTSPLDHLGGGGLSGKPLLPIVTDWIRQARKSGLSKPILGGGGVLSCRDAERMLASGASAVSLGTISIVRPWRVQRVAHYLNERGPVLAFSPEPRSPTVNGNPVARRESH